MEKDFVTYKQALALKELGFDEPCFGDYYKFDNNDIHLDTADDRHRIITDNKDEVIIEISAPLYQQAFRFFREKHNMNSQIAFCEYAIKTENSWKFTFDNPTGRQYWEGEYKTYEEAEQNCLDKLIEICKNK